MRKIRTDQCGDQQPLIQLYSELKTPAARRAVLQSRRGVSSLSKSICRFCRDLRMEALSDSRPRYRHRFSPHQHKLLEQLADSVDLPAKKRDQLVLQRGGKFGGLFRALGRSFRRVAKQLVRKTARVGKRAVRRLPKLVKRGSKISRRAKRIAGSFTGGGGGGGGEAAEQEIEEMEEEEEEEEPKTRKKVYKD